MKTLLLTTIIMGSLLNAANAFDVVTCKTAKLEISCKSLSSHSKKVKITIKDISSHETLATFIGKDLSDPMESDIPVISGNQAIPFYFYGPENGQVGSFKFLGQELKDEVHCKW